MKTAKEKAGAIIRNLKGRGGMWELNDAEVEQEILEDFIKIIES